MEDTMAREPDPQSPAQMAIREPGDCIADVPADLLDLVAAEHGNREPEPVPVDPEELT